MLRKIEVSGVNQKVLENQYHRKIHEINAILKKLNATYNDWDNADERTKSMYTREKFKTTFIDYQLQMRRSYIYKLRDVRNGYIYE